MVGARRPWAVIVAVVGAVVVALGALVTAIELRGAGSRDTPASTASAPGWCVAAPCEVLADATVGGTRVELIADRDARSGRLRIGGDSSSDLVEASVTDLGVTLTSSSLQCVSGAAGEPSACLIRGPARGGVVGQVVTGGADRWISLAKPIVSDAGYLALAQVTRDAGPEVIAAAHDCARGAPACAHLPVRAEVFALTGVRKGCTTDYSSIDALPGFPQISLSEAELRPC